MRPMGRHEEGGWRANGPISDGTKPAARPAAWPDPIPNCVGPKSCPKVLSSERKEIDNRYINRGAWPGAARRSGTPTHDRPPNFGTSGLGAKRRQQAARNPIEPADFIVFVCVCVCARAR